MWGGILEQHMVFSCFLIQSLIYLSCSSEGLEQAGGIMGSPQHEGHPQLPLQDSQGVQQEMVRFGMEDGLLIQGHVPRNRSFCPSEEPVLPRAQKCSSAHSSSGSCSLIRVQAFWCQKPGTIKATCADHTSLSPARGCCEPGERQRLVMGAGKLPGPGLWADLHEMQISTLLILMRHSLQQLDGSSRAAGEDSGTSPGTDVPSSVFHCSGCADPSTSLKNVPHLSFPGQQALIPLRVLFLQTGSKMCLVEMEWFGLEET